MNSYFSVGLDFDKKVISFETDFTVIEQEDLAVLLGNEWTDGSEFRIGKFHLLLGSKGFAWFALSVFTLYKLNSNENGTIKFTRAETPNESDSEFKEFLNHFAKGAGFLRTPVVFLNKEGLFCFSNEPMKRFGSGIDVSEVLQNEIKTNYQALYTTLFMAWDSEFTSIAHIANGLLAGKVLVSPNWLQSGCFAGFKLEFQPDRFLQALPVFDSLSNLPLLNPNPVLKFSAKGILLFANDAASKLLETQSHQDESPLILQLQEIVHRSRDNADSKMQFEVNKRWFLLRFAHTPDESLIYFSDITEEHIVKQEFEQTFAQLTAIINSSRSSIILLSVDRSILFFNQRARKEFRKFFGFELEEGIDLPELDASISKTIDIAIQTAIDGKHQLNYELDFEYLPGKTIWFSFMLYPITDQADEVSGVCLSIQNITRSKVAEKEVERVKTFYETILNNLPSDIAVFDSSHHYLFLNPHAIKDPEMRRWMIGKTDYDFVERRNLDRSIADKRAELFDEVVAAKKMVSFIDLHQKEGKTNYIYRKFYPVLEHDDVKLVIGYGVDVSAIKEAEQKLVSSENRFKGLFENNPMLLFIVDEHFIIQELNHAAKLSFNFAKELSVGADFRSIIAPEHCEEFTQKFAEALRINPNETYTCYCGMSSRNIQFSIEFTATPVFGDSGQKMLLLAGIDQTERIKSEEKIRESEEFNRLLVKEMPIPFAIIDGDKAVFLNDACRMLIGADENTDLSDRSLFSFVDPAYHALIAKRLQIRYSSINTPSLFIKIFTMKGEQRFVEMQGGFMKRGGARYDFVTFIDRTEETAAEQARKEAESALVESEQKLSLLVASLPVVPYSVEGNGLYNFSYLNERVFQLIGYTSAEVLAQPGFWVSRIHLDDLTLLSKASKNFNTNNETTVEYRMRNAFELEVWIRETIRRIFDSNGEAIGVTGVFQDISNEKRQSERRRLIESTLFEISKEDITTTDSLYAFYSAVYNRLKSNLGISGLSIWRARNDKYAAIESFHSSDDVAYERTQQLVPRNAVDSLLKVVNTASTDSRDHSLNEAINLNLIFGIPQDTSLLLSLVRVSLGDNLLILIEHNGPHFTWEYEHFNLVTSLSELMSFNLEYFQRIDADSKLQEAFRLAKIGAWELEPEANRIYWSEAMFEFYGMDSKTSRALTFDEALNFIHPDDKTLFEVAFNNLRNEKQPYKLECRHVLADGKVRYFEKSALAIPSGMGNTLFMGVTVDITEKKLAEREDALRQRSRLVSNAVGFAISPASNLNELFEFFALAFIQTAPANKIAVYSDETNAGRHTVYYNYPKVDSSDSDFATALNLEILNRLNNAELTEVSSLNEQFKDWLISPIKLPELGKCYLAIRLTSASEATADLIAIAETVIQLIQQKGERIYADTKLRDLNMELTETNLQLRQYSYIVSHNLRAPVANILGCLNLINTEDATDARNKILMDGLKISANSVESILQDLNKILNIKENVVKQFEYLVFESVLKDVMSNLNNDIQGIPFTLSTDFEAVKGMMAFKPYLISIFQNLISNSFRYRRPEIPLELSVSSKVEGHKIVLHFRDNGRGIDLQKNRKRLFKLYERFHSDVAGTGLGLNMVQEQVRVLGGSIQVESELDAGTNFILTFVPKI